MKSVLRNEPVAVLDACALIAFLNNEDGAGVVADALQEVPLVKMAAVNVLEVAYDAVRQTGQKEAVDGGWLLAVGRWFYLHTFKLSHLVWVAGCWLLVRASSYQLPITNHQ